ncbi:1-deoxy-D-xylulose-5-phosphate reductoisomerase [Leucothrix arctica]|uniref:1-deoxy-D-xylulose 5-phosphate reductoisomerase n=1 Tax=Leucothrix arctica TaxID=1481894 RepID=A0A317CHS7_9GAMM|nr:1-deoxy-D-xylulose-5-phosphate reductoisomerase [Leucothrix arctica]PWQ98105.1 1-deoxy-D-xylulose-5-phosphate reductoisomerase [Leucothrix arctica]
MTQSSGVPSKGITILGATGSIGVSTLDVISRHPDRYHVIALTANIQTDVLFEQCRQFKPKYAVMVDEACADVLCARLKEYGSDTVVLSGAAALERVSALDETDYVMAAIVGAAGLLPSLAAANAGKRVLLANKEALVMSGKLFMDAVKKNGAELLPIDSEHNAIFQSMPVNGKTGVKKILLTGSGGPFRSRAIDTLSAVTPEEAVAHPNWSMGQKISVDSATMMNKGLEVIEACWLFDVPASDVQVVVHPQSTIHSMVSYVDGSVIAQMGNPDMRTPIAYSLAWPDRIDSGVADLDFFDVAQLDFEKPNFSRFPCLKFAYDAHETGGYASIALNAANEVAVASFLSKQINFTEIPQLIEFALERARSGTPLVLDEILVQDRDSREHARLWIKNNKK